MSIVINLICVVPIYELNNQISQRHDPHNFVAITTYRNTTKLILRIIMQYIPLQEHE